MAAPHSFPDLQASKRAAREHAQTVRTAHDPAELARASAALAAHVLRDCPPPPGAVVSGVWPLEGEVDLRPLMQTLHARGHTIVLPATPPRGQPLTFLRWRPGDALVREKFGTFRPAGRPDDSADERPLGRSLAEPLVPDFLLVPLLAFDRRLHRLGYGGGYYDRTLVALPPNRFALGFGLAAQQMDAVPVGPNDVPLDAIATEHGIIRREKT
jgi:5-formyltetrahydrofolate cyclo-ligase